MLVVRARWKRMFEERNWLTEELRTVVLSYSDTNTALLRAVNSEDLRMADGLQLQAASQRAEIAMLRLRLAKYKR